jgi:hypothetical protein
MPANEERNAGCHLRGDGMTSAINLSAEMHAPFEHDAVAQLEWWAAPSGTMHADTQVATRALTHEADMTHR